MPWFDAYEKMHFEHGYDAVVWPTGAGFYDANNWLYQLVGRSLAVDDSTSLEVETVDDFRSAGRAAGTRRAVDSIERR